MANAQSPAAAANSYNLTDRFLSPSCSVRKGEKLASDCGLPHVRVHAARLTVFAACQFHRCATLRAASVLVSQTRSSALRFPERTREGPSFESHS